MRHDVGGTRRSTRAMVRALAVALALALVTAAVPAAAAGGPLVDAVKRRDAAEVRALLADKVGVNDREGDGATALHWAVDTGDAELVDLLLAAGATPGLANDLGVTPLHLACAAADEALVTRLLRAGAAADPASAVGVTPLMEASRTGNIAVVKALLAAGASARAAEPARGQTALMWAVSRRHADIVQALLAASADVRAKTVARPVTVMRDRGPGRGAKTSVRHATPGLQGGSTGLHFAAQVGDAASARLLLGAKAPVDETSADGMTPLVLAAFSGHGDVARVLLEHGADANAAGAGYTALHAAAMRGDLPTTQALLAHGAQADPRLAKGSPVRRFASQWALPNTFIGATPLFIAAAYQEAAVVEALLKAGASPNVALPSGMTPLLVAAGVGFEKEVRPSDLARWNLVDSDFPEVPMAEPDVLATVQALVDAGADVNAVNGDGNTAMHPAASLGMVRVIQLLADHGAKLDVVNKNGRTPLDLATPRVDPRSKAGLGSKAAEDLLKKLSAGAPK